MKLLVKTMGCKVNSYESEAIMEIFQARGYDVAQTEEAREFADVFVINTCTVTHIADRKSRQMIRRFRKNNPQSVVVVTGCYAQTAPSALLDMDEIDLILGNAEKNGLPDIVENFMQNGRRSSDKVRVSDISNVTCFDDTFLISSMNEMSRAFVKIEEGCNRFCSYCVIPYARGPVRSRNKESILHEVAGLVEKGYREIVLAGINTALYGTEDRARFGENALYDLIGALEELPGDFRLRLSSLEPTVIDAAFMKELFCFNRLCHHVHLSLQSGSNRVLSAMRRHYSIEEYLRIIDVIRDFDPNYGITTDIIVGFPGEDEKDFKESLTAVKRCNFSKVHAFQYSDRHGTEAFSIGNKVAAADKNRRLIELTSIAEEIAADFAAGNVGSNAKILIENTESHCGENFGVGYSENYLRTFVPLGAEPFETTAFGGIVDVKIEESRGTDLIAASII